MDCGTKSHIIDRTTSTVLDRGKWWAQAVGGKNDLVLFRSARDRIKGLATTPPSSPPPTPADNGATVPDEVDASLDEYDTGIQATIGAVGSYTMTSPARIAALINAVRYVTKFRIPGAIVECGVWRGGSMMAVALTLSEAGDPRPLYLFDTFEGMPPPGDLDVDCFGRPARDLLGAEDPATSEVWAVAAFEDVRRNMLSTGYPSELIHFAKGRVEDTIPEQAPQPIALLRLDTDFYESTRHELDHLVERVSPAGVLIIDDYGHWEGARRAVDEWLETIDRPVLLNRIDYTGRIAVLP